MGSGGFAQLAGLALGAVLTFAAVGSAWGTGVAGMAAIGAWKKSFMQNKAASFVMITFVGAPLTQTVYGMIVMNKMAEYAVQGTHLWSIGILTGIAMGASAFWQGKAGAVACDALAETGKGFGNYIIVVGIVETVALFVMAFALGVIGNFPLK